jgi:hypothetical protein
MWWKEECYGKQQVGNRCLLGLATVIESSYRFHVSLVRHAFPVSCNTVDTVNVDDHRKLNKQDREINDSLDSIQMNQSSRIFSEIRLKFIGPAKHQTNVDGLSSTEKGLFQPEHENSTVG